MLPPSDCSADQLDSALSAVLDKHASACRLFGSNKNYHLSRTATDSSTCHSVDEGGVEPDRLRGITLLVPQVS